jgi:hypothetical protein
MVGRRFETMWGRALSAKDVDCKASQDRPKRDKNRGKKSTQYGDIIGPGRGCEQTLFISNQGNDLSGQLTRFPILIQA